MDELIFQSKTEERMVLRATERRLPISGAFELLPLCNLHCSMCYIRRPREACEREGGLQPVDFWLGLARQLADAGTLFLLLTGGEPFLYPDFRSLYAALSDMGFILTINTNGTLIGPEEAQFLAAHMPRRVNVTLYGASPETYRRVTGSSEAFERTIFGIRALLSAGVPVKMNVSLVRENMHEQADFYRIAQELGIPLEVNSYMYPAVRAASDRFDLSARMSPEEAAAASLLDDELKLPAEVFAERLKRMAAAYEESKNQIGLPVENKTGEKLPCRAARSSFWIDWKGTLSPCVFLTDSAHGTADLHEDSFDAAWKRLTQTRETIALPAACADCAAAAFCQVCCAAAWHENHDFAQAPDYVCRMTLEKLRRAAERLEESKK